MSAEWATVVATIVIPCILAVGGWMFATHRQLGTIAHEMKKLVEGHYTLNRKVTRYRQVTNERNAHTDNRITTLEVRMDRLYEDRFRKDSDEGHSPCEIE